MKTPKAKEPIFTPENWKKASDFIFHTFMGRRVLNDLRERDLWQAAQAVADEIKAMEPKCLYSDDYKPIRQFLEVARTVKMGEREKILVAIGFVIGTYRMEDEIHDMLYRRFEELLDKNGLPDAIGLADNAFVLDNRTGGKPQ